mgnify:CR=1 FL=1
MLASGSPIALEQIFELLTLYQKTGREQQFIEVARNLINQTQLPSQVILEMARLASFPQPRFSFMAECLTKYLEKEPNNPDIWLELAAVYSAMNQQSQAINALKQAIQHGGEPFKEKIRNDPRLQMLRNNEQFNRILTPPKMQKTKIPELIIP